MINRKCAQIFAIVMNMKSENEKIRMVLNLLLQSYVFIQNIDFLKGVNFLSDDLLTSADIL